MIRIGMVGCGHIGTVHSFALRQLGDAGLVDARVVGDLRHRPRARRATSPRHHDARAYEQLDDLLGDVDVVWVCTWTAAHREAVDAAAGSDLEPSSARSRWRRTLAEAEQLAARARRGPAPGRARAAARARLPRRGRTSSPTAGTGGRWPRCSVTTSTSRSRASTRRRGAPTSAKAGGGTLSSTRSTTSTCCAGCSVRRPASPARSPPTRRPCSSTPASTTPTTSRSASRDESTATIVSVWHQILTRGSRRRLEVFCEDALLWTDDDYLGPAPRRDPERRGARRVAAAAVDRPVRGRRGARQAAGAVRRAEQGLPRRAGPRRRPRPRPSRRRRRDRGAPARRSGLPVGRRRRATGPVRSVARVIMERRRVEGGWTPRQ